MKFGLFFRGWYSLATLLHELWRAGAQACKVELPGYGAMRAVIFEDPDGQLIELIQLPSADEIQRVRAARRTEQQQPTA